MKRLYVSVTTAILIIIFSNSYAFTQYHGGYGHGSDMVTISGTIAGGTTNVRENNVQIPESFELYQNFPNPFNPETIITFSLPVETTVTLEIFNIVGQKVAKLIDEHVNTGRHEITFYAGELSSGVYLYRLRAGDVVKTRKMMLVR